MQQLVDACRQEQRRHEHPPEQQGRIVTPLEHVLPSAPAAFEERGFALPPGYRRN
jgi:hypothetical protein